MTKTTDTRQLRLLISGCLKLSNIDDLTAEARLTDAVMRFFKDSSSESTEQRRVRILSELGYRETDHEKRLALVDKFNRASRLNIKYDAMKWQDVFDFIEKHEAKGETVEEYFTWQRANPFTAPATFKIAEKPSLLMDTWTLAFTKTSTVAPERKIFTPAPEKKFVPRPEAK